MPFEDHLRRGHPITLAVLAFFSMIELIMTAVIVADYNRDGYPSGSIEDKTRFLLFTSLWTFILALLYTVGQKTAPLSFLTSIASHGIWLFLTWIFWLSGAGAITSALGGGLSCGGSEIPHCGLLNGIEAFAWINWIITSVAFLAVVFIGYKSARGGDGFGGPLFAV